MSLKARPDLDIWSCSSKADDLECLPIRRCPFEVSSSSLFRRSLTLIVTGRDDCAPHSRHSGPSLSPPSIHSYSSCDAPHCKSKHPISDSNLNIAFVNNIDDRVDVWKVSQAILINAKQAKGWYLPFSDMEDPRSSHRHRDQPGFSARRYPSAPTGRHARLRDILQTPVPVVVVVRTKLGCAFSQFVPCDTIKRHAHVVFAGYPRSNFRLFEQNEDHRYRALMKKTLPFLYSFVSLASHKVYWGKSNPDYVSTAKAKTKLRQSQNFCRKYLPLYSMDLRFWFRIAVYSCQRHSSWLQPSVQRYFVRSP